MRCKNCGAQNADTAAQCENCGAFLKKETEAAPVVAGKPHPPKKKIDKTAIAISIVVGVIIVAIIATCVVLAVRHKQETDDLLTGTSESTAPLTERPTKQNSAQPATKAPQTERETQTKPPETEAPTQPTTEAEKTTKETTETSTSTTQAQTQQQEKPDEPENQPNE